MIDLVDVGKSYVGRNFDVPALRGVTLSIPSGQYVSVVGKSGSGKSTLMKIIGLLDFDHSGTYRMGGHAFADADDRTIARARRRIGYVFQDFQLVQRHTIRRNLELAMVIRTGRPDPDAIDACLAEVGLADKGLSYPDELSGGQKQRVAIARAVLGSPDVLIADEPTGALDSTTAATIMALLAQVHARRACALVLVTHDPELAARAERTLELVAGEVAREVLR